MRIGIIGAGFVGQNVARLAIAHGHEVMVSNSRSPRTLFSVAAALGCQAATAQDAAQFGDIVLLAVPLTALTALPAEALAGKVVVDANNYYPQRDGRIAELDAHRMTTSELVAQHLPGAQVVKAFSAIRAIELVEDARPAGDDQRRVLPIAGDNEEAKRIVIELTEQFGYDAFDAGTLADSWRFERDQPAYCVPLDRAGITRALEAASRDL